MDNVISKTELAAAAKRIVGALEGPVKSCRYLARGVMNHKYCVVTSSGTFVVRFYPAKRASVVHFEPDIIMRCRQAGGRVPKVIADSRSGPPGPLAYVVYKYIEGFPLSIYVDGICSPMSDILSQEIVSELSIINSVRMEGYCEPIDGYHASSGTWIEFVNNSLLRGCDAILTNGLLPNNSIQKVPSIATGLGQRWKVDPSRLAWVDVGPDNIIIGKDRHLVALIDFEGCICGDPLLTLGYAYAAYGNSESYKTLLRDWCASRSTNEPEDLYRIHLYSILRVMRIAPYAHEPLPTGAARAPLTDFFPGFLDSIDAIGSG